MSRVLTVQWICDAVACGIVVYAPLLESVPPFNPTMPGDWKGTAKVQFCPKHAHLVHTHRSDVAAPAPEGERDAPDASVKPGLTPELRSQDSGTRHLKAVS